MKAIIIQDDQSLVWQETETPEPGPGEVRIKVKATAINRADLMQRAGLYPPPPGASKILGLECFGEIESIGESDPNDPIVLKPGDPVCALLSGGGYAEYVVCPASHCIPVPSSYENPTEFAGFAEVYATIYLNLFMEAGLTSGDQILLHAGASGIGTAAIQVCKAKGIESFVTVGSQDKLSACLNLGATAGTIRGEESFSSKTKDWTKGQGFTAILDPVGGNYLNDNIRSLTVDGRLIVIGLMGGVKAELDIGRLLVKRLRVVGSTLRSRSKDQKTEIVNGVIEQILPEVNRGNISLITDKTFTIQDIEEAFKYVGANQNIGKVLLTLP